MADPFAGLDVVDPTQPDKKSRSVDITPLSKSAGASYRPRRVWGEPGKKRDPFEGLDVVPEDDGGEVRTVGDFARDIMRPGPIDPGRRALGIASLRTGDPEEQAMIATRDIEGRGGDPGQYIQYTQDGRPFEVRDGKFYKWFDIPGEIDAGDVTRTVGTIAPYAAATIGGGVLGGAIAGPPGALIGAALANSAVAFYDELQQQRAGGKPIDKWNIILAGATGPIATGAGAVLKEGGRLLKGSVGKSVAARVNNEIMSKEATGVLTVRAVDGAADIVNSAHSQLKRKGLSDTLKDSLIEEQEAVMSRALERLAVQSTRVTQSGAKADKSLLRDQRFLMGRFFDKLSKVPKTNFALKFNSNGDEALALYRNMSSDSIDYLNQQIFKLGDQARNEWLKGQRSVLDHIDAKIARFSRDPEAVRVLQEVKQNLAGGMIRSNVDFSSVKKMVPSLKALIGEGSLTSNQKQFARIIDSLPNETKGLLHLFADFGENITKTKRSDFAQSLIEDNYRALVEASLGDSTKGGLAPIVKLFQSVDDEIVTAQRLGATQEEFVSSIRDKWLNTRPFKDYKEWKPQESFYQAVFKWIGSRFNRGVAKRFGKDLGRIVSTTAGVSQDALTNVFLPGAAAPVVQANPGEDVSEALRNLEFMRQNRPERRQ